MPRPSILVTYKLPSSATEPLLSVADVDVFRDGVLTHEQLVERVKGRQAIVVAALDKIDKEVIDAGRDLKIVANVAVGYNNIDVAYARARGLIVTNTPDVLTDSVADFTWALILGISRRLAEGDRLIRANQWRGWAFDFMLGTELRGKQLGLVGLGRIGHAVAARAGVFGMRVAYAARRPVAPKDPSATAAADGPPMEQMSLDRLLNTSDVVSLHVPLSADTTHLIDKRALAR